MFNHTHAKAVWFAADIDRDGTIHNVMIVETGLALNSLHPQHDKEGTDSLLRAVADFVQQNQAVLIAQESFR